MLDTKRAEALSKSGALGIGAVVEQQLRASVIGSTNVVPAPAQPLKEREQ
jgi:hypothetical protein